jgi:hypothetical protein
MWGNGSEHIRGISVREKGTFLLQTLLILLLVTACYLFGSRNESITITKGLVKGSVALINATIGARSVQLECFVSEPYCVVPKSGTYSMVRVTGKAAIYMDCPNVEIYEPASGATWEKKIGQYCLLED